MSYIPNKDSQNVTNRARGTKRSRPHHSGHPNNSNLMIPPDVNDVGGQQNIHAGQSSNEVGSDLQDDCIDVDVPLSKKINRLNIDYSASNSNDLPPQSTFKEKYPYESDSNYYQTNEMLYTLHEERLEYYYF